MNKVWLIGRLTRDPEVRYTNDAEPICIARFSLAVDSGKSNPDKKQESYFFNCVAFRNTAKFAEKYLVQGTKISICGHLQTGSYTNNNGQKVNTVDIVIEQMEFAGAKPGCTPQTNIAANQQAQLQPCEQQTLPLSKANDGFAPLSEADADNLPFN